MSRYAARAALRALLPSLVLAACRESAGRLPTTAEPALARASADAASSTPRDPGRPVEVPAESVEAEIAAARREAAAHHHRGAAAASEAIRAFDLALTSRALHDLAFTALFDLREQRGADARTLRQHLARAYNRAATGVHHAPALGFASGDPCLVSFDQPQLIGLFAEAEDPDALFTSDPHWRQPCGAGQLRVEPLVLGHFHLLWEDPTVGCIDPNTGRTGRASGNDCVPLDDPLLEHRSLGVHNGMEVVRIQRRAGDVALPFTLKSFVVASPQPVRVRWRTGNGPWKQWPYLAGNAVYDASAHVVGATEVQITHAGTVFDCTTEFKAPKQGGGSCPVGGPWFVLDDVAITP